MKHEGEEFRGPASRVRNGQELFGFSHPGRGLPARRFFLFLYLKKIKISKIYVRF